MTPDESKNQTIRRETNKRMAEIAARIAGNGATSNMTCVDTWEYPRGYRVAFANVRIGPMGGVSVAVKKSWVWAWVPFTALDAAKGTYERHTGRCYRCMGDGYVLGVPCTRCHETGQAPQFTVDPHMVEVLP